MHSSQDDSDIVADRQAQAQREAAEQQQRQRHEEARLQAARDEEARLAAAAREDQERRERAVQEHVERTAREQEQVTATISRWHLGCILFPFFSTSQRHRWSQVARTAASAKGKLRARQESAEIQRDEKDKARADEILKLTAKKKTLSMLKLGTLKIKAAEAGVDSDELEDVDEAEDVKGEVIRLILQTQTTDEVARECSNGRLGLRLVAVAAALTVDRCCANSGRSCAERGAG